MDVQDSSPAASGEDDRMSPVADGMVKEATVLFHSRTFAECIVVLNLLLVKKGGDPKVLHNIIVAEYFRDGCSDPKRLLNVLEDVKKICEELDRASRESTIFAKIPLLV